MFPPLSDTGDPASLVAGVDTHSLTHTLAILTATGGVVSTRTVTADPAGYTEVIRVLHAAGTIRQIGVEGTNSYGAGLARALSAAGFTVWEVLRPSRTVRRLHGKSDPIDAIAAARAVLAGEGVPVAKDTTSTAESVRVLLDARTQLVRTMTVLANTITGMLVTAPEPLRTRYRGITGDALIRALAATRPAGDLADPAVAVGFALRTLAQARQDATERAGKLENQLRMLLETGYPRVLDIYGAGTIVAAKLVAAAGGNPGRIRSEAAFASLCGAAPIPASSGKTTRHRLNRGGDRRGNSALHRIALVRMQHDPTTQAYIKRRTAEGKTLREVLRCLKRAIAREAYRALTSQDPAPGKVDLKSIRTARKITLTTAAQALGTWPARISDIEHHTRPLPELTNHYQQWLTTP